MDGIPKGLPRQPRATKEQQSRCRDWPPEPLAAELLALHRRGSACGWGRAEYLAIGTALLARGRSGPGHLWCSLADRVAEGVAL